jgi:ABC-type Mn2+/Zn2+ transport system ATPase subunit
MSAGLVCEDVTVSYRRRPAVHHLSCALPGEGLVAVVGPNGAGKTTLLHAMLGWLPTDSGRIAWAGRPLAEQPGLVSWLGQRRVQESGFPADVATVVATGRYRSCGLLRGFAAEDRAAVDAAMAAMHVADLADRPFAELSGGQQQRVLLARAFATGAKVLLLDEPLTGLDAPSAADLLARLRTWATDGRLAVAVIHDLEVVRTRCTHALLMNRSAVACGPVSEAMRPEHLARCYGGPPPAHIHG